MLSYHPPKPIYTITWDGFDVGLFDWNLNPNVDSGQKCLY
jgi:hypothetical protein